MQRQIAASRNLTTLELNHLAENDFSVDSAVDARLKAVGETEDRIILDSRMAWLFVPDALAVHVTVRPDTGDGRLLKRLDEVTEKYTSHEEAQRDRELRARSERERFRSFYGVDIQRLRNYDVVVDSTSASPDQIVDVLEMASVLGTERASRPEMWLSPLNLIPSEMITSLRDLDDAGIQILSDHQYLTAHPIDVIYSYPYFMVVDGHKRLSASLSAGLPLVPARLVAEGPEVAYGQMTADVVFAESLQDHQIFDWEGAHQIDLGLGKSPSRSWSLRT